MSRVQFLSWKSFETGCVTTIGIQVNQDAAEKEDTLRKVMKSGTFDKTSALIQITEPYWSAVVEIAHLQFSLQ